MFCLQKKNEINENKPINEQEMDSMFKYFFTKCFIVTFSEIFISVNGRCNEVVYYVQCTLITFYELVCINTRKLFSAIHFIDCASVLYCSNSSLSLNECKSFRNNLKTAQYDYSAADRRVAIVWNIITVLSSNNWTKSSVTLTF